MLSLSSTYRPVLSRLPWCGRVSFCVTSCLVTSGSGGVRPLLRRALAVCLAAAFLGFLAPVDIAQAQMFRTYRVVVHPDNPLPAVPTSEVSDIFLGKKAEWSGGIAVRVVERPIRSEIRGAFTHDIHDRSVESVHQLWQRRILTGRVLAPDLADTDEEVLRIVASDPGAIGYVSADTPLRGVREMPVVEVPERISYQAPRYTETARRARVQGVVLLRLEVDEEGRVADVDVVKDLPMGLTSEAVRSARSWRYEPALLDDEPVGVSFDVAVRFAIDSGATTR